MAETLAEAIVVDEFAQTRGVDDLFNDEIIPISADQQAHVDHVPREEPKIEKEEPAEEGAPTTRRSRGHDRGAHSGERGRGRGRGRGGRGRGGRAVQDPGPKSEIVEEKVDQMDKDASGAAYEDQIAEESKEPPADDETVSPSKPSNRLETPRVQAVRGDRSGTGGVRKPKLTEEELTERMATAKLNAAKIAAAHARAEADEASFQEREKVAAAKRRQEFLNRKVMDGERERNRLRKLGAQTGREWDAEKTEVDFTGRRGGSQYRRGMHGGITGSPQRHNDEAEPGEDWLNHRGRGRGRGGRGRARGGHRGNRGDFSNRDGRGTTPATSAPSAPIIDNESEFPALSGSSSKNAGSVVNTSNETKLSAPPPKTDRIPSPISPMSPSDGTWADQMESSSHTK